MYDQDGDQNNGQKYTLNDLNGAAGVDEPESQNTGESAFGGGVWGAVAKGAATGQTTEMKNELAKRAEFRK